MLPSAEEPLWEILQRRTVLDTPWLGVEEQDCQTGSGALLRGFYTLRQPDWVLIMARTAQGQWILERQYRHGIVRWLWEFPAGILDGAESVLQCAQRELREETGYGGGTWLHLRSLPVNPDRQSGQFHVVLARDVEACGGMGLEVGEDLRVHLLSDTELQSLIAEGALEHPHHLAAWLLYLLRCTEGREEPGDDATGACCTGVP